MLLPLTIELYRKIQRIMRSESQNAVGILRRQSGVISAPAGTTNLNRSGGVTYPADLLRPVRIRERASGSETFVDMKSQEGFMPDQAATVKFSIWDWRDDKVWLPAAIGDRQIQLLYEAALDDLVDVNSVLAIPDLVDPLAHMVASTALRTRDENKKADLWWADALDDIHLIVVSEQAARAARSKSWGVS